MHCYIHAPYVAAVKWTLRKQAIGGYMMIHWSEAGLIPTTQRQIVLSALEGRERPASAMEVYEQVRTNGHRIGLTTVYRVLHALTDAGLVHTFSIAEEQTYRHCQHAQHCHLVCKVCGLVAEHPVQNMARWFERIRLEQDFVLDPERTELHGVCGPCRRDSRHHPS